MFAENQKSDLVEMVPLRHLATGVFENFDNMRVFHAQKHTTDDVIPVRAIMVHHLNYEFCIQ